MNAVIKYPSAKWSLAHWIIDHFPPAPQLLGAVLWQWGSVVYKTTLQH